MQLLHEAPPRLLAPSPLPAELQGATGVSATIFLPKEHGSWSLALEPLALGMLLAPSPAGGALLAAVLAGFFARRPLKAAETAGSSSRRRESREALVMFAALIVAGGFETLVLGDSRALWPVALAVPCGVLFAYFDAQGESRATAAELAGSAAFAVLPATFATLAGWTVPVALSLAALALVRSVPTVLTVRTFLRQRKGERASGWIPLLAALLGLGTILILVVEGQLPWLAAGGALLLLVRTAWLVGPWRPDCSARRAGITEAVIGVAYLGIVTTAFLAS